MSGFPSDLRARVYRSRRANGSTAPDPTVGLRLRSDPFERHGRVWQWVVDIDPGLPTLTEVLASCHDFLVDDDCGREVGVVEGVDVDPDSAAPERLRVVQGGDLAWASVLVIIHHGSVIVTMKVFAKQTQPHDET